VGDADGVLFVEERHFAEVLALFERVEHFVVRVADLDDALHDEVHLLRDLARGDDVLAARINGQLKHANHSL